MLVMLLKLKLFVTLLKNGKADFIQRDGHDRLDTIAGRFCGRGERLGSNSEYNMGKWEFIDKEQSVGSQWVENY